DKPVIAQLDRAFTGRWGAWVKSIGAGKWMLDLWAANEEQLRSAGLRGDRIFNPRLCTACRTDLFFSYRRGHHGRLVSIAALPLCPRGAGGAAGRRRGGFDVGAVLLRRACGEPATPRAAC